MPSGAESQIDFYEAGRKVYSVRAVRVIVPLGWLVVNRELHRGRGKYTRVVPTGAGVNRSTHDSKNGGGHVVPTRVGVSRCQHDIESAY